MNGSHSQHRDEPQEENLGLDLVSQVASSSRAAKKKPKRSNLRRHGTRHHRRSSGGHFVSAQRGHQGL